ncbi:amidohydrolase family protein [Opitutus sp. GAS368]|uniref:N-acetylglucosamine-6-phosphate deacetylase n=1 Tax=Opitutus sp. GAS368 TaxID=1882749 RepID=UPI00087B9244|nr:amidohydrolase family protein [Opitutus sp. GAS368]SDS48377.1 N-acetylglucosamine-6-phosphate deacetylase [Opitutus sp. GAS368]
MPSLLIRNVRLVEPGKSIRLGEVLVHDGHIVAAGTVGGAVQDAVVVNGNGRLLTPGLIDVHTHGIMHSLYEAGPEGLRSAARELGRFGVTTVLPTIVPQIREGWLENLGRIAAAIPSVKEVHIPGLHVEGPFMAVGGAACPTLPGDLDLLERILEACAGRLAVMSVSPDTPNIVPVIRRLRQEKVTVFLTHTRAGVAETEAALDAGAVHATHFYDVFYAPAETEPGARPVGAVEAILADPRASVDFIADGVHVHPTAIRAAVAAKTWAGVILITDSNIGAGLPPGVYDTPWGYRVKVSPGDAARHETKNFLAGSALTMDRGMANLLTWLRLPPEQVWAMGTLNPARLLGLGRKGRLEPGADADLVLWDENLTAARTWVNGHSVYEK